MPKEPVNTRLAAALSTWESWPIANIGPPKVIKALDTGTTNTSFVIAVPGTKAPFRLRLHNSFSKALGIVREQELLILEALAEQKLSPKLIYTNTEYDFTLFEFIQGRCWTNTVLSDNKKRYELHKLIEKYQSVKPGTPKRNYVLYLQHYIGEIQKRSPILAEKRSASLNEFWDELKQFDDQDTMAVLSHHDLIPENILETDNGLMIIDWEYAAVGHPDLDVRYVQHNLKQTLENDPARLLTGDTLDKLLHWIFILWTDVDSLTKA